MDYKEWLAAPYNDKSSLSVVITSYHTPIYTILLLDSLRQNVLKMPNVDVEVLLYEDHRKNKTLQKYVESLHLDSWHYFAVPKEKSTSTSVYGRREGVKQAKSKYITFLDGDDLLTNDAWRCYIKSIELLEMNGKTVMSEFNVAGFPEAQRSQKHNEPKPVLVLQPKSLSPNYTIGVNDRAAMKKPYWVWNKVYRASFLKSVRMFNSISEDRDLSIQSYLQSMRTNFVDLIGYIHFYGNEDHLANQRSEDFFRRPPSYYERLEETREFVSMYKTQVEDSKSSSLKKIFDVDLHLAEDIWVMSLGSNCTDIYAINDGVRKRGPLDNLHSKRGLATVDNIFNYRLEECLLDAEYTRKELKHSTIDNDLQVSEHYCSFETEFEDYRMNHNDFEDPKVKDELRRRIECLYKFIDLVKKEKGCFFVYCLGMYDFDESKDFKEDQFKQGLKTLEDNGVLDKTIFISTNSPKGGYWNFSKQEYLQNLGLNAVEVEIYSGVPLDRSEKIRINNAAKEKTSNFIRQLASS